MYYKPMGDLPYISSQQGGVLVICTWLIYEFTRPIPIQELHAEEGGGLIIIYHGLIIRTIRKTAYFHCIATRH